MACASAQLILFPGNCGTPTFPSFTHASSYNWRYSSLDAILGKAVGALIPVRAEKLYVNFFVLPLFVVISTTPLDPREPYIPVAAASFNISTDSISFGLIVAKGFVLKPPRFPFKK